MGSARPTQRLPQPVAAYEGMVRMHKRKTGDGTVDFTRVRTYPIIQRANKFRLEMMIPVENETAYHDPTIDSLAKRIVHTKQAGGKVVAMMGGAVIKEGCSLLLVDLMKNGWIDHVAGNGAVSIHDFEIALCGETSEDVCRGLEDGTFGMAEETGSMMNAALKAAAAEGLGYGAAIGTAIRDKALPHRDVSVLYQALKLALPATMHIAIGGDIIHQHPSCDGAVLGATSYRDFVTLAETVSQLRGGVLLNIGSAVLMPEVFLKALTVARNLGFDVRDFATANFDFMDMYRPRTRVIEWPRVVGAEGFDIRGEHRNTIPALHRAIKRCAK